MPLLCDPRMLFNLHRTHPDSSPALVTVRKPVSKHSGPALASGLRGTGPGHQNPISARSTVICPGWNSPATCRRHPNMKTSFTSSIAVVNRRHGQTAKRPGWTAVCSDSFRDLIALVASCRPSQPQQRSLPPTRDLYGGETDKQAEGRTDRSALLPSGLLCRDTPIPPPLQSWVNRG